MWAEVSSSTPYLLRKGILASPSKWRCLLRVLHLVWSITTLECVLLKGKSHLRSKTGARNQFLSLSLSTTMTAPHYQMLVIQTAFYFYFYILPRDPPGWLRSYKLLNRTISWQLEGFISSYPSTPSDPILPHYAPGRDIFHFLALLYQ
jgi:hypothetical protein